jgi:hypothetical protein
MSTRGIIARKTGEGTFAGRYHHWDSYPEGLGKTLVMLHQGHFKGDLGRMLEVLIDEHPAGWSTINGKDFSLKPGYVDSCYPEAIRKLTGKAYDKAVEDWKNTADQRRPICYCHGKRHEEDDLCTEKTNCGAEWIYVFDIDTHKMEIFKYGHNEGSSEGFWNPVGVVDLNSETNINWTAIQCGENFERCGHYAWHHQLAPKSCNLGTRKFLGYESLEFRDAIAVIIESKRYKLTGSGGDADFLNKLGKSFPSGTWVATIVAKNGRRMEKAVAIRDGNNDFKPYPGVTWVYPKTKAIHIETTVKGETCECKH